MNLRLLIAAVVLASAAAFAFWPISSAKIAPPTIESEEPEKHTAVAALDLAAFRTPIWVAEPPPPAPVATAPPPPPPPPLKLQLLAIIREPENGGVYKAAVYDPDTDRILIVAAGQTLGSRTVDQVDQSSLTLRDDAGKRVLALKEGGAP